MPTYTVVADAATISTGRVNPHNRKPEVVRLVKGQDIEAPEDHPSILMLLSTKAIRLSKDVTGKEKITARHVLRIFKEEGVTATPNKAVDPIDAPLPVTDPNELVGF